MIKTSPVVSVITALHNKGRYILETAKSVLDQGAVDCELIVIENGSTDDGPDVVRNITDPRVRLLISPKNGPGAARNVGIANARGEWILFLDADDLIEPGYLAERLQAAESKGRADLVVGCWEEFLDSAPNARVRREPAALYGTTHELEESAIAYAPWALHAALVRRSRVTPERGWDENLDHLPSEDAAFWFPVVLGATVAWSHKAGALYRTRTPQSRNEIVDGQRRVQAVLGVIRRNLSFAERVGHCLTAGQLANVIRAIESSYRVALKHGDRVAARLALTEADRLLAQARVDGLSMRLRQILGLRLFNLMRFGAV